MKQFGRTSVADMRRLSAEQIMAKQNSAPVGFMDPVIDGWFLPADMREIYGRGAQNDVPIMMGATTNESSSLDPAAADIILTVFPADTGPTSLMR